MCTTPSHDRDSRRDTMIRLSATLAPFPSSPAPFCSRLACCVLFTLPRRARIVVDLVAAARALKTSSSLILRPTRAYVYKKVLAHAASRISSLKLKVMRGRAAVLISRRRDPPRRGIMYSLWLYKAIFFVLFFRGD